MLFNELLDPAVCVREIELSSCSLMLFPEELAAITGAVENRQREFAGGRACARQALEALGFPSMAIPAGLDRAPIWPVGVVGSISHSLTRGVAAVARQTDGFISIGVDLEESTPLDEMFAIDLCTPFERDWLKQQPSGQRGLLLKAMFSAKECAYKCQYPLSKTLLEYSAIRIELDAEVNSFSAHFEIDADPFKAGSRLNGQIVCAGGHFASAIAMR